MILLKAEGNCLRGACKMLNIMIVEKAIAASIWFPTEVKVKKVRKTMSGHETKKMKTASMSKVALLLFADNYSSLFSSTLL